MLWVGSLKPISTAIRGRLSLHPLVRLVVPLCCLLLFWTVGLVGGLGFETSRNRVFDTYQRLFPAERPKPETILIDIDAASLRQIGQWPWRRDQLAHLVDKVASARVIGLDLLLQETDRLSPGTWATGRSDLSPTVKQALFDLPSTDNVLAASLSRAPIVLAAGVDEYIDAEAPARPMTPILESGNVSNADLAQYAHIAWPLPIFARSASGLGVVSVVPERDGILRRLPLIANVTGTLVPSFDAEILRIATGSNRIEWRATSLGEREAVIDGRPFVTDQPGQIWPRYGEVSQFRIIPAYQVLNGNVPESTFRDRIVLIGASAAGLTDVLMTPSGMPETGLQIEANLLESMLAGDMLWRPAAAPIAELLIALALSLAAALLIDRLAIRAYVALFGCLTLGVFILSLMAFTLLGLLFDWTFPVASLVVVILTAFIIRLREEAIARHQYTLNLAAALFQAEAGDRAKTEFLANASHELRTPLNAIIGFSEIMAMELHGPILKIYAEYSRDIHMSATHLLSIINDMLELTVIDLGGRDPARDRIGVPEIMAECVRMASPRAHDRLVEFVTRTPSSLPVLIGDTRMVRQMLLNLISNAVKYSPAGGSIIFTASVDVQGWLCLSIRDSGPGIAASDLPNILSRFARLRSATLAQEPGIGIGLVLTKSMVELHGGKLKITSELGSGTEATLCFPSDRLAETTGVMECEQVPQFS